jgi:hypothetical protein
MKEKLLWLTVVFILAAMLTTSRAQSPTKSTTGRDTGRFQLFQANDKAFTYRIDTQTGQTWRHFHGVQPTDNTVVDVWTPIIEVPK